MKSHNKSLKFDNKKLIYKKPYEKPKIESEKIFETQSLACGKCEVGPIALDACLLHGLYS